MLNIEGDFFTLYKSVDAICRDMFGGHHYYNDKGEEVFGLSAYIKVMETESNKYRSYCPDWDAQYKKLKRLRWIRTQIAHEVGASECTKADLDDLKTFYNQLMNQTDILAKAYSLKKLHDKAKKASKPAASKTVPKQNKTPYSATPYKMQPDIEEDKKPSAWPWLIGIAAFIIILILIIKNLPG